MPNFQTKRVVPFTRAQMFDVVADIERYPEFLPLCERLIVNSREVDGDVTVLIATMDVGYKSLSESVATRVELKPALRQIDIAYLEGPFKHLDSAWRFLEHDKGCEVDFHIDYAFASPMLELVMGSLFDKAFRKFSQSFQDRAAQVYG